MAVSTKTATSEDVDDLLDLMSDFYAESAYDLNRELSRRALDDLIEHPSWGRVWLVRHDGRTAGYIVLTVCFSMEYGGLSGNVDDLFVRPEFRRRGLGRLAMEALLSECRQRDVRAVHVEVDQNNRRAKNLYGKVGFREDDRELMTCKLKNETTAWPLE
jgi:ribosomal protein S18 acetylase RimI-like enzyme